MTRDKGRKWLWRALAVFAAMQLYFVREILAAYLLFTIGFACLAILVAGIYVLQTAWEGALGYAARYGAPVFSLARRGWSYAERPFRRPGSQPVQ
ncbi:MAG TPA: hypothetical protein VEH49_10755 [Methylomirabilota bacterium]|jgi:hypothetical protein|nr:hypothetical protein [Methylomirabilota bacterium]